MAKPPKQGTGPAAGAHGGAKGRHRGHGDGSIYRREGDGRWVAVLSLEQGKRKYLYGATREEVRGKLLRAQADQERGLPIVAERQTVAQYLTLWLESSKPHLDYDTWRRYRELVELHIVPTLGRLRLPQLTPQHLQRLYAARMEAGLSTSTVRHLHATLHKALEEAVRFGLVARNVSDLVRVPRLAESEIHPLTREQARTLLDATGADRLGALYAVALCTGMRVSELLGLRWGDADLDDAAHPTLRVRVQLKRDEQGAWVFRAPKTKRSRRQIALAAPAVAALRAHRAAQAEERLALGPAWHDYDLIFCTQLGKPLDRRNVYRHFVRVLARAGLPRVRFHDLRHTCATVLLGARVNPKVVSEMLGHASIAITLDIYSHVLPDMQQDAAEALTRALGG